MINEETIQLVLIILGVIVSAIKSDTKYKKINKEDK